MTIYFSDLRHFLRCCVQMLAKKALEFSEVSTTLLIGLSKETPATDAPLHHVRCFVTFASSQRIQQMQASPKWHPGTAHSLNDTANRDVSHCVTRRVPAHLTPSSHHAKTLSPFLRPWRNHAVQWRRGSSNQS